MKRSIFTLALSLLLLSLLTSCVTVSSAFPQYTPSGNAAVRVTLNDLSLSTLTSFDGFSATREPIINKASGIPERFDAPAVSRMLYNGYNRVIPYGSYLYYSSMQKDRADFRRVNTQTGAVETFSPAHTDGLLLSFAVVGDEKAPYIFYAVNTDGISQKEGTTLLKSDVWSTALYAFDTKTGETYTVIEDCAAIHRIHSFVVSGDRIYLSAAIYALNAVSGEITVASALLSVSTGGGDIDVLISDERLDEFFLSNGDVSITTFDFDEASPTGKGAERVIRIDSENGEVNVSDMPEALCGAAWRTVIGDSVYFHRDDGCIYRLPLCDLSGDPTLVADAEVEILMYTDKALYAYGFTVTEVETEDYHYYKHNIDLDTFYRISTDGSRERVFGSESIKICETVLEQDNILYCRTTGNAYLIAIDLASGEYTVLETNAGVS